MSPDGEDALNRSIWNTRSPEMVLGSTSSGSAAAVPVQA